MVVTHVTGGDSSVCGNDWANDDYTRTLQFIPQDDGTIQIVRSYNGTFTTIPDVSQPDPPDGCPGPQQTGGVTGTLTGFDVVVVTWRRVHSECDLSRSLHYTCDARDLLPG